VDEHATSVAAECETIRRQSLKKIYSDFGLAFIINSSVSTASAYGLDGPGIESRWWARFSAPVQTGPGDHTASYTMSTGSFLGVKRPGRGADHPPHIAPRLKKEYSYTSTPPLGLRGLIQGEMYLNF